VDFVRRNRFRDQNSICWWWEITFKILHSFYLLISLSDGDPLSIQLYFNVKNVLKKENVLYLSLYNITAHKFFPTHFAHIWTRYIFSSLLFWRWTEINDNTTVKSHELRLHELNTLEWDDLVVANDLNTSTVPNGGKRWLIVF
jgi:hypothetical protein